MGGVGHAGRQYLRYVERLFSPDLFIVGGGVSEHAARFVPLLTVRAEVVPTAMGTTGHRGRGVVRRPRRTAR